MTHFSVSKLGNQQLVEVLEQAGAGETGFKPVIFFSVVYGLGSVRLEVRLDGLKGFFQLKRSYDSMCTVEKIYFL